MKKNTNILFASFFLLCLIIFLVIVKTNKPRVLIVHSYATNFKWVQEINVGLDKILHDKPYSVKYIYMDTKRNPEPDFIKKAGANARKVIDNWRPDVVLAIDDNAQKYVGRYYLNHPSISIVFAGVNGSTQDYGYDKANNVTGILERLPFDSFKEVFMKILPENKKRIVHLSDNSPSSKLLAEELNRYDWHPLELLGSIKIDSFSTWKEYVKENQDEADVLLISHYHTLKTRSEKQRIAEPEDVIAWTEKNTILPNIGCWSFFVQDGGMMAIAISGNEQGEESAKMCVQIIDDGKKASEVAVKKTKLYVICLKESELERKNVEVPEVYEMFAKATNNYYK